MAFGRGTDLLLRLKADASQAKGEMRELQGGIGGLSSGAKAGALAAGAAVAAFAVKSINAFAEFDTGMREVFTLMPGMSQQAMGQMTDNIRELGQEFAITTDQTVPALYQAISAGVPAENVLTFMETAAKLARGGVTDLETAVRGLSTIVNAYGEDVVDAADASDILFTAVKYGVTTVEEMSRSIFQVIPIASQLGISFDQVAAAMVTLTTQGTPTRVAATQLRQALAELSQEGSEAWLSFEAATGETFPAFIARGGTVEDAMAAMGEHADVLGTQTTNLFGSIEAGMGAASLASETGGEKMGEVMEGMENRAGSTDEAYETMSEGIGFTFDELAVTFEDLMLTVGELLAELQPLIEAVTIGLGLLADAFPGVLGSITAITTGAEGFLKPADEMEGVAKRLSSSLRDLGDNTFFLEAATWDAIDAEEVWILKNPELRGELGDTTEAVGLYGEALRKLADPAWAAIEAQEEYEQALAEAWADMVISTDEAGNLARKFSDVEYYGSLAGEMEFGALYQQLYDLAITMGMGADDAERWARGLGALPAAIGALPAGFGQFTPGEFVYTPGLTYGGGGGGGFIEGGNVAGGGNTNITVNLSGVIGDSNQVVAEVERGLIRAYDRGGRSAVIP